ncbi:MAG: archaeal heat shock protein Hsp20 [Candidatus Ranarchaeia archaeon]
MFWDDEDDWFSRQKRRFPNFFDDFDALFRSLEKEMQDKMRKFFAEAPDNMIREKRNPDGSVTREFGPFVYGYSMRIGPDGKPEIQEFGNVKPGLKPNGFGFQPRYRPQISDSREPLIDINDHGDTLEIIAELPGVEKEDIKVNATSKTLTIDVNSKDRKYHKTLKLPAEVDPKSAKCTYKNGVLDTFLKKMKSKDEGEPIQVT